MVLPTDSGKTAPKGGCSAKKKVSFTRRVSNVRDSDSKARDDVNAPELGVRLELKRPLYKQGPNS